MATNPCVVMLPNDYGEGSAGPPAQEFHKHTASSVCRCCIHSRNYVPGRQPRRGVDGLYPPLSGRVRKSLGCLGSKRPRQNAVAATRTVSVD
jgi:hypothetical protein